MNKVMTSTLRFVARLVNEERGDQNISNLGLIVVSVAIIGILMAKLAGSNGAFAMILDSVVDKIKAALGV